MSTWRIKPAGSGNWWHLEKRVCFFWVHQNSASSPEALLGVIGHLCSQIQIVHKKPNRIVESA